MMSTPTSTALRPGDIALLFAPSASKPKYQICLMPPRTESLGHFLFISSESKSESDLIFDNDDFSCIPPNGTGQSVVGFNSIIRIQQKYVDAYGIKIVGYISNYVASEIEKHVVLIDTLTPTETKIVLMAMAYAKA